jgi:hypothetical protein
MMILAAFPMKPETVIDYLFATGWDLTLPITEGGYHPYEFTLNVAPAFNKYIALFWRKAKAGPYSFKRIAEQEFPDDLPQIGAFVPEGTYIDKGETLEWFKNESGDTVEVHLIADFSRTY